MNEWMNGMSLKRDFLRRDFSGAFWETVDLLCSDS